MQTIHQCSKYLQDSTLPWLTLGGCLLVSLLISTPTLANKSKTVQTHPQPKTQPKVLANRLNTRGAESERKGKKGESDKVALAPLAKKGLKHENLMASRTSRVPETKLKTQLHAQNVSEKPRLAKVSTKTNGNTPAATKSAQMPEQPLSSRLARASFTPLTPLKPQTENDRRGKFGKRETRDSLRDSLNDNRRTDRDDEKAVASIQPIRRTETVNLREPERNSGRNGERNESTPASRPRETNTATDTPAYQIQLPDQIEVIEYGSTSPTVAKLLTLPEARPLTPFGAIVTKTNTPPSKRNDLAIPQQRVLEIQYELVKRGFYNTEPNGLYDEATILAMWEFQKNYGLPATGYPSAHALKRLGLTSW